MVADVGAEAILASSVDVLDADGEEGEGAPDQVGRPVEAALEGRAGPDPDCSALAYPP
jgi:hypothetical protein